MMLCLNPHCLESNSLENSICVKCGENLKLSHRYRPIKYLGEGGFGRTFIAVDEHRRNTHCVIKQFLPLSQGTGALQKCIDLFHQEAELLDKLGKYPQIPDLLAFFEQENRLYLIQEFIEGDDLLNELQIKGRFTEDEVKTFLLEMLPVLNFIHQKNVIHRDIKPENIIRRKVTLDTLITGNQISDLVLIDFGVSKQVSATVMTKLGTGVGTPGYSAPEQSRGMVHPSSDLYSLAVTAIRLLTGILPSEQNNSDELFDMYEMRWIWREYLQEQGINIDVNLAEVLEKMLQDRISDRFQTAKEVLEQLQPKSSNSEIITPPQNVILPPQPSIKLKTQKADYHQLDQLLSQQKWQEADQETAQLMLTIMNKKYEGWLKEEDCNKFPQEELRILDDLWKKYSNNHFGFSIQTQIWMNCGGNLKRYTWDIADKFADRIGWRTGGTWLHPSNLNYTLNAPQGHLPSAWRGVCWFRVYGNRAMTLFFLV
jgi:serine/threonine protein kinase